MSFPNPHQVSPRYQHLCDRCHCLGHMSLNGKSADLFVCDSVAIARFGDGPEDYLAAHLSSLSARSDVFLLAAFRLYLDARGEPATRSALRHGPNPPLQS
jgi:hypothetical protein